MSDAEQNLTNEENSVIETKQELDYKALYEKAQSDIQKIAAKKDELLNETKQAKAEREAAKQAALTQSEKNGEFEKLWQATKKEKDELVQSLQQYKQSIRNEKLQVNAMRIATELADGDNAELLSEFIVRNLDKMADDTGALSADVIEAVKDEFKGNNKYKALLRGSKAAGGGAPGNAKAAQETSTKEMNLTEYNKLTPQAKLEFSKLVQVGKAVLLSQ